jgi:hypothetical protein
MSAAAGVDRHQRPPSVGDLAESRDSGIDLAARTPSYGSRGTAAGRSVPGNALARPRPGVPAQLTPPLTRQPPSPPRPGPLLSSSAKPATRANGTVKANETPLAFVRVVRQRSSYRPSSRTPLPRRYQPNSRPSRPLSTAVGRGGATRRCLAVASTNVPAATTGRSQIARGRKLSLPGARSAVSI